MKNKWSSLFAGVVIQVIFGGIYAWSTFVPKLVEGYGLSRGQCGFIFGLTIAVFTVAMTFANFIVRRRGIQFTVAVAGILFMLGYIVASFSGGSYSMILLGVGGITGVGIGLGYSCPLSAGMKWFPDKKGLVTGVAVAGFGGGAVLLSSIAGIFLDSMTVLEFFRWFGFISGALLLIAAFFLTVPKEEEAAVKTATTDAAVISWPLAILTLGMFSGTFSGLLVIGNLTQILTLSGFSSELAVAAISIFAIGNMIGRVSWGHAFDRFSYICIPLSLSGFALAIILLLVVSQQWIVLVVVGLLGFGFGANFVVYASAISRFFGTESFAKLYPLCFLGYGVAGLIGPSVGGWLADQSGSYNTALYCSAGIVFAAAVITMFGVRMFSNESDVELVRTPSS